MKNALGKGQSKSFRDSYLTLAIALLLLPFATIAQVDSNRAYIPVTTKIRYTKPVAFSVPIVLPDTMPMAVRDTGALAKKGGVLYIWRKLSGLLKWYPASGSGGGINSIGLSSSTITVPVAPLTSDGVMTINLPNTGVTPGTVNYPSAIAFDPQGRAISWVAGPAPIPQSRILTINGVSYDLTSDRSWTISGSGGGTWGSITGTLSSQTDLWAQLQSKFNNPTGTTSQMIRGDGSLGPIPAGNTNSNVGAGYRLAIPNTNNIKTFAPGWGMLYDTITTNTITQTVDTGTGKVATKPYVISEITKLKYILDTSRQSLTAVRVGDSVRLLNELGERVTAWYSPITVGGSGGGVIGFLNAYLGHKGTGERLMYVDPGDSILWGKKIRGDRGLTTSTATDSSVIVSLPNASEGAILSFSGGQWGPSGNYYAYLPYPGKALSYINDTLPRMVNEWDVNESFTTPPTQLFSHLASGASATESVPSNGFIAGEYFYNTSTGAYAAVGTSPNYQQAELGKGFKVSSINLIYEEVDFVNVYPTSLNTGTDSIALYIGLQNNINNSSRPTSGMWLEYASGTSNWRVRSALPQGANSHNVDTGIPVVANADSAITVNIRTIFNQYETNPNSPVTTYYITITRTSTGAELFSTSLSNANIGGSPMPTTMLGIGVSAKNRVGTSNKGFKIDAIKIRNPQIYSR